MSKELLSMGPKHRLQEFLDTELLNWGSISYISILLLRNNQDYS